ncbi:NeuD/PglB/VioB family sugar acetyltransferase [Halobacillus salinus]|uniref:Sugar transferase n=1 Tax=Halobacillus salinus TaxID=192814 RepID=A0A4Z0GZN6_9BACI|nr:hypothetical protein E4663_11305 [Halobacillus salinus]
MIKRILDLLFAGVAMIILSPVFVVIAVLVRTKLGSPVLFKQQRSGLNGRPFVVYKFRTMTEERDQQGELLPDEVRLTSFGQKMRASSLDELPQLLNVLKGDMSLVGPRPLLMEYLSLYSERQAQRLKVKPGVTGWAQVNGRNTLDWEERFELDVWYVENRSLLLDARIMWLTVNRVLTRKGVSHEDAATMPKFEKDPLIIIGAGAQGGEMLETALELEKYNIVGFVDDDGSLRGQQVNGVPVLGPVNTLNAPEYNNSNVICAIGQPRIKKKILASLAETDVTFVSLIHPTAYIAPDVKVGVGSYIAPHAVVSNQSVIGSHVLLNYGCTIGHDCKISDYASIYPGVHLSGHVQVKEAAEVGSGVVAIPGTTIGEGSVIGAGAVVIRSIPSWTTAVGSPARVIKILKR